MEATHNSVKRAGRAALAAMVACALAAPAAVLAAPGEAHAAPKISAKSKTLAAGKSFTLRLAGASGKVKWSSSDKKVAAVSSKGKVTAKAAGTATVTARIGGKKVASCKVTVRKGAAAHVHSWKKVVVKEAWEEWVGGESYVYCNGCGAEFSTYSEHSKHEEEIYMAFIEATNGMSKEEVDKLAASMPTHSCTTKTRPSHRVEHPAQYAYKCACGATK